jgi:predicted acetyltransferase
MTDLEYAHLSESEAAAFGDILARSFPVREGFWERNYGFFGPEPHRVVRRDGRVVGGLLILDLGQWLGGRLVPMAGIADVAVAPAERGTGAATALLAGTLRELRDRGVPISVLWPSTQKVYRRVGYEQAGSTVGFRIPAEAIGIVDRSLPAREVDLRDWAELVPIRRRFAENTHGCSERSELLWRERVEVRDPGPGAYAVVVGPESRPEGYAHLMRVREKDGNRLIVKEHVALTGAARRRIWTYVADCRSMIRSVDFGGSARGPDLLLFPEQAWAATQVMRWMMRIVDVPAALAARGYPAHAEAEVHLGIEDDVLPENAGRFVLRVAGGRGEVEPGGDGALRLHVRDLAPLYSGLYRAAELRELCRLEGNEAAVAAADRAFASPEPWLAERF